MFHILTYLISLYVAVLPKLCAYDIQVFGGPIKFWHNSRKNVTAHYNWHAWNQSGPNKVQVKSTVCKDNYSMHYTWRFICISYKVTIKYIIHMSIVYGWVNTYNIMHAHLHFENLIFLLEFDKVFHVARNLAMIKIAFITQRNEITKYS